MKNRPRVLLIDDTRDETSDEVYTRLDVIARNHWEGMKQLMNNGPWNVLFLDHDLNSFDLGTSKEYTGYDIACALEKWAHENDWALIPKEIYCVSSNPEGRKRINMALKNIEKMRKEYANRTSVS